MNRNASTEPIEAKRLRAASSSFIAIGTIATIGLVIAFVSLILVRTVTDAQYLLWMIIILTLIAGFSIIQAFNYRTDSRKHQP